MGCKCENPTIEKKDEIESQIKKKYIENGTNNSENQNVSDTDQKFKSSNNQKAKYEDDDNHSNNNIHLDGPITFPKENENDNLNVSPNDNKNNYNNNIYLNENEIKENEINENERNKNEINENERNENERNENERNENEINENERNENEIKEYERNENEIKENEKNENERIDINKINENPLYLSELNKNQLNEKENSDNYNKNRYNNINEDQYEEPNIEDPFNKRNTNEEDNLTEEFPDDDFSKYIFEHINLIRKDPKSFISEIENSKSKIKNDKNGRLIYKSKVKVALYKGLPIFEETISVLEETEPMDELKFCSKICIPLPDNEEDIKNKNYLKQRVEEINQNYEIKDYWRDIIKDPETSFILMIVDDTGNKSGKKRSDILNPTFKYIGISSVMIGKSFVCYVTFSDKI